MIKTIDGAAFSRMMLSAAAEIDLNKQKVNELNVFPVPDGDTGTNMSMTLSAASTELRKADGITLTKAADKTASALLRGARGNSGVILSLLFRGFSKSLKGKLEADGKDFAAALTAGVEAAYKAVMKPAEGTILTVSRLTADAARDLAEENNEIEYVLQHCLDTAHAALDNTVNQNPVLKKAGVVDAGGMGFCLILRGMLESFGFAPQALDTVCVTFDKLDKVGPQGVAAELEEKAMPAAAVQALEAFLEKGAFSLDDVSALCADKSLGGSVRYVLDTVGRLSGGRYAVEYTPSLVRGQGYYTGMVFEVTCAAFSGAVAGGGRYDDMVGKFLGQKVPAVGFSIGFERICSILLDQGYAVPDEKPRLALLYGADADFADVLQKAEALRGEYAVTVLAAAKKVGKQLDRLQQSGCAAACFYEKYPEIKPLGENA